MSRPVSVAGWATWDAATRERVLGRLRPALEGVAEELGANNADERRELLEVLGLAALTAAGWRAVALRPDAQ